MQLIVEMMIIMMSMVAFIAMGIDKMKARKNKYRIRETTLWFWTIAGGAIGTFIGMKLFRHKTRHRSFAVGVPLLALVQLVFILWRIL